MRRPWGMGSGGRVPAAAMRRPAAARAAALAALLGGLLLADPASACTCPSRTPSEHLAAAAAAFAGTVHVVEREAGPPPRERAHLLVEGVYKGAVPREAVVRTEAPPSSCGVQFLEGRSYLVFAGAAAGGVFWTGLCDGTTRDLGALADAGVEREPVGTAAAAPDGGSPDGGSPGWLGAALALVVAAGGAHLLRLAGQRTRER